MSELKPCPFCGAIPQSGVEFYESCGTEVKLAAVVKCTGCGVYKKNVFKATGSITFVPFYDYENAFNDVVEAWNGRAKDDE